MGGLFFGFLLIIGSFVVGAAQKQSNKGANPKPTMFAMQALGVLVIVGSGLLSSVVQIPAGYQGVRLTFGAMKGVLPPGIHLITPGADTVELIETRTQKEEAQATAASSDLQIVTTTLALNYRIDPAKAGELYMEVGPLYKARIIDPTVQESLKVVTAKYTAEELIRNRAAVRASVESEIIKRLEAYNIVVDPTGLSIVNFEFSEEFNRAIEAKQVAQQEAEKQKYVLQRANLEKQTEIARAEGKSQAARLNAEALKVAGAELVIAREWIDKWDGKLPEVSAGGSGGGQFIIDLSSLTRAKPANP